MIAMTLTHREKIALEEYIGAAEELYAHLADSDRPPRLAFLVRQLGSARPPLLEVLSPATRHVG